MNKSQLKISEFEQHIAEFKKVNELVTDLDGSQHLFVKKTFKELFGYNAWFDSNGILSPDDNIRLIPG